MVMNLSKEYLMENSKICLQPRTDNNDIFKVDELDLELYIRVDLEPANGERCTFKLPVALYSDEILKKAVENTKNSFQVESLAEILGIDTSDGDFMPIDVVSTKDKMFGSSALAFPDFFYDYCIKNHVENLFIIPSSIHELLVIRDDGDLTANDIDSMINIVNATVLNPTDVLSDHVYHYGIHEGITWGTKSWFERAFG